MNEIRQTKFGLGASVLRKEDNAFITGAGCYTDDKSAEDVLYGYVLRSPMAHAKFAINDVSAALDIAGVHAVITAEDIADLNSIPCMTPVKQPDGSMSTGRDIPILCAETVRHVGDAIAFIVADTTDIARDAAEHVELDFEILRAVVDTAAALEDGNAKVYDDGDGNLAFSHLMGDREKTDQAFAGAAHVAEVTLINNGTGWRYGAGCRRHSCDDP